MDSKVEVEYLYYDHSDNLIARSDSEPSVRAAKIVRRETTWCVTGIVDTPVLLPDVKHVYVLSFSRGQGWYICAVYDTDQSARDAATKMTDAPSANWIVDADGSWIGVDALDDYEFKIKRVPMEA